MANLDNYINKILALWLAELDSAEAVALDFLGKLLNPQGKPRPLQKVSLN